MDSSEFAKLGGSAEVAELLGISKQQLTQMRMHPDFPPPCAELASGPIWKLEHIRRWMDSTERRSRGRPSTNKQRIIGKRFKLEEPAIGEGGFANVYRAEDRLGVATNENSVVAIKILKIEATEEEIVKKRFIREVRLLQGIDHPNVVQIIASGEDDGNGNPWYAMPLAQGSLEDHLETAVDSREILDTMKQICIGLQHLHEEGFIHRDLKPANILLTRSATWAISDFGLAREIVRQTPSLTSSNVAFGTPGYMAPEVWDGVKFVGVQSDIFSLGRVLQYLVRANPQLSQQDPVCFNSFQRIIQKATEYDLERRYNSVEEMLAAIDRIDSAPREITNSAFDRLRENLLQNDTKALNELMDLILDIDDIHLGLTGIEGDLSPDEQIFVTLARLTEDNLTYLWENNRLNFREVFKRFADHLAQKAYPFGLCDILADFVRRVISVSQEDDILKAAIKGLYKFGYSHNRWHVRSVLLTILQGIRTADKAYIALDALLEAQQDFVRWEKPLEWILETDPFLARSYHPVLRDGIQELLKKQSGQLISKRSSYEDLS